jgi:CobQ/CobB/MinD/ParA nucleotide binding domain
VTQKEEIPGVAPSPGGLAKDVARLYSYAHVEEGSYRVFPRAHRPASESRPLAEVAPEAAPEQTPAPPASATSVAAAQPEQAKSAAPSTAAPNVVEPNRPNPQIHVAPRPLALAPLPPLRGEPSSIQKSAIGIVSIAGGVGKTTLAANLGRILGSRNEHVLLVDASGSGLLPFYFGAEDLRSGLRTFLAPEPGSLPIRVLGPERVTKEWLERDVKAAMTSVRHPSVYCRSFFPFAQ